MTTKDRDSLKGILKEIKKERNAEIIKAKALKTASGEAIKEREDKGWSRAIINPLVPTIVIEEPKPKKKPIKKKKLGPSKEELAELERIDKELKEKQTEAIEKAKLKKELQEAQDKLAAIEAVKELEKETEAEIIADIE